MNPQGERAQRVTLATSPERALQGPALPCKHNLADVTAAAVGEFGEGTHSETDGAWVGVPAMDRTASKQPRLYGSRNPSHTCTS